MIILSRAEQQYTQGLQSYALPSLIGSIAELILIFLTAGLTMSLPCCYTPFNRAPMCAEKNPNPSALHSKSSLIWPQLTLCRTSHFSLLSQGDAHHFPLALPCSCGSLCLSVSSSHRCGCKLTPPLRHSSASAECPQHLDTTFTLAHLLSCTNVLFSRPVSSMGPPHSSRAEITSGTSLCPSA